MLKPVRKAIIIISSLFLFSSCVHKQVVPPNATMFRYVDKDTHDTIKFYAYKDLDTAIYYAKKENKNILVVFSGWATSTRGEWRTLAAFDDEKKIAENFIIAWLPVDDKKPLIDTNQVVLWGNMNMKLKTIGDRYSFFQNDVFKASCQPQLCFIDTMKMPIGETTYAEWDKAAVTKFINSGLKKHE
ncbi:MAG: hypothetical protein H0W73_05570 [Bacteroidetes bacterium]|nr:hypothetical protein [Bacteroidota bacterium]